MGPHPQDWKCVYCRVIEAMASGVPGDVDGILAQFEGSADVHGLREIRKRLGRSALYVHCIHALGLQGWDPECYGD